MSVDVEKVLYAVFLNGMECSYAEACKWLDANDAERVLDRALRLAEEGA